MNNGFCLASSTTQEETDRLDASPKTGNTLSQDREPRFASLVTFHVEHFVRSKAWIHFKNDEEKLSGMMFHVEHTASQYKR